MNQNLKVGIVGAGIGGLAAGMLLSAKGINATIFEKEAEVGGRCRKVNDFDNDYIFDSGPTFLMMPFLLEDLFWQCGKNLHNYVNLKQLEPFYRVLFDDNTIIFPGQNSHRLKDNIKAINPGDIHGYDRFIKDNIKKFELAFPVLTKSYIRNTDMFNKDTIKFLPYLRPHKSFWDEIGSYFEDERLKLAFSLLFRYIGIDPYSCPSLFSIIPFIEHSTGVFHVMGGLNQLPKAMKKAYLELGGNLHLNAEVKDIKVHDKKGKGFMLANGTTEEFDELIMNTDFVYGVKNLLQHSTKYNDQELSKKTKHSMSTFVLYLGLKDKYQQLSHHNFIIPKNFYNCFNVIKNGEIPNDPIIYIHNPSVTDYTLAPESHSTVKIIVPVPNLNNIFHDNINWDEYRSYYTKKIISKLEQQGIMKLKNNIEFEKVITPLDWEREYNLGFGACFGLDHTLDQLMAFRPKNQFEEISNLWLVGAGTNPGGCLPFIIESAKISSYGLLQKYGFNVPDFFIPPVTK